MKKKLNYIQEKLSKKIKIQDKLKSRVPYIDDRTFEDINLLREDYTEYNAIEDRLSDLKATRTLYDVLDDGGKTFRPVTPKELEERRKAIKAKLKNKKSSNDLKDSSSKKFVIELETNDYNYYRNMDIFI